MTSRPTGVRSGAVAPASAESIDLVGTWRLIDNSRWQDGVLADPDHNGKNPRGYLFYLPDNHVSVIIARSDRQTLSADRHAVSTEERAQAWSGFNAYAGTYTRQGTTVVHHIELNSYENDVGRDYVRQIEVVHGDLILSTPPQREGGHERVFKLRWRRVAC